MVCVAVLRLLGLAAASTLGPGESLQELRTLTEGELQEPAEGEVVTETEREGRGQHTLHRNLASFGSYIHIKTYEDITD